MGIKLGGIDIGAALVNAELRLGTLEKMVEALLNKRQLDSATIEAFREETLKELQEKYPEAGIKRAR